MGDEAGWKQRTHTCGALNRDHENQTVVLNGWVESVRDHGGIHFIDLRDRYGITQVVLPQSDKYAEVVDSIRSEYVLSVEGRVRLRPDEMINPKVVTGEIEVEASDCEILNPSKTPPIEVAESATYEANEEVRLRYRYLDLRRKRVQEKILLRHKITRVIRDFMETEEFLDLETPILTRSTPEGARDFLVPSRYQTGSFYALPQSPQLFKQLFMIAGYDRYYQVVRCFRDEDLRADRQPEFTQLDIEMAFIKEDDVIALIDRLVARVVHEVHGREVALPINRMPYSEAMRRFGSDAPDLRFGLEIMDVTEAVSGLEFNVFKAVLGSGGTVRGILLPAAHTLTRKEIDERVALVQQFGAKGLAWVKFDPNGPVGPLGRFLDEAAEKQLRATVDATDGDVLLMVADQESTALNALGQLRLDLGRKFGLMDPNAMEFVWVVDFPLFDWSEEDKRWVACHHPFTSPREEDLPNLESDPGSVLSRAYDIVLNGVELGGGSIRIHREQVQQAVFKAIALSDEEARHKFGFLLDALSYGAPPHGGIALGLDRFVMLMSGADSIRDVIPFPKTASGTCLMTNAPSTVATAQLNELGLVVRQETPAE
jgi:aspartyl-tRNA synthetase